MWLHFVPTLLWCSHGCFPGPVLVPSFLDITPRVISLLPVSLLYDPVYFLCHRPSMNMTKAKIWILLSLCTAPPPTTAELTPQSKQSVKSTVTLVTVTQETRACPWLSGACYLWRPRRLSNRTRFTRKLRAAESFNPSTAIWNGKLFFF